MSIFKQVVGSERVLRFPFSNDSLAKARTNVMFVYLSIDERTLKDVNDIIKMWKAANPEINSVTKPRVGPGLYNGRRPAIKDDEAKFSG